MRATSDRVDIANEASFDPERTDSFSIVAWVRLASNAAGAIFMKEDWSTGAYRGFGLFHRAGTSTPSFAVEIQNDDTGNNRLATRKPEFSTGSWHHVVLVYSGNSNTSGVTLYVDGTAQTKTDEPVLASRSTAGATTAGTNMPATCSS